jgi:hypothetical protein
MADPDLCDETFAIWVAFLNVLEVGEIMLVVDQTFALIVQHWSLFSEETQLQANKTIISLTQKYDAQLRARIEYLPSLANTPMLSKTEGELVRLKAMVDPIKIFQSFGTRCKDQNAVVVRQARSVSRRQSETSPPITHRPKTAASTGGSHTISARCQHTIYRGSPRYHFYVCAMSRYHWRSRSLPGRKRTREETGTHAFELLKAR